MDLVNYSNFQVEVKATSKETTSVVREAGQMSDTVLRRLMEEVKNDNVNPMFAYDRAHNRHNRGR